MVCSRVFIVVVSVLAGNATVSKSDSIGATSATPQHGALSWELLPMVAFAFVYVAVRCCFVTQYLPEADCSLGSL